MTPKERTAMQQALEALEEYRDTQMIKAPRRAITALREAQAGDNMSPTEQAQQESVAEVVLRSHKVGFGRTEERKDIVFLTDVEVGQKLYAAPVRTKNLTDDEIAAALKLDLDLVTEVEFRDARAVIAADREKNK